MPSSLVVSFIAATLKSLGAEQRENTFNLGDTDEVGGTSKDSCAKAIRHSLVSNLFWRGQWSWCTLGSVHRDSGHGGTRKSFFEVLMQE
eukprot:scaffold24250_cov61-Attheya_sp.AAC.9